MVLRGPRQRLPPVSLSLQSTQCAGYGQVRMLSLFSLAAGVQYGALVGRVQGYRGCPHTPQSGRWTHRREPHSGHAHLSVSAATKASTPIS